MRPSKLASTVSCSPNIKLSTTASILCIGSPISAGFQTERYTGFSHGSHSGSGFGPRSPISTVTSKVPSFPPVSTRKASWVSSMGCRASSCSGVSASGGALTVGDGSGGMESVPVGSSA